MLPQACMPWMDETVVSWEACLPADSDLTAVAAACLAAIHDGAEGVGDARRLTLPSPLGHRAALLLPSTVPVTPGALCVGEPGHRRQ